MLKPGRAFPIKEVLILLHFAGGYAAVAERLASLGLSPALFFYLGLFGLMAGALILAAYIRNGPVRWLHALVLAASSLFLESYVRITADPLTYDAFINMMNSSGGASEAFEQHVRPMALALFSSALLFAGIGMKPRRAFPFSRYAPAAPAAAVILLSAILFVRGGEGATGLPGAFTPLSYSAILGYEAATGAAGPRQEVKLHPRRRRAAGDIVLIIDESIGGNYLDINSKSGVRSGLAEPRPGIAIRNYGYAASVTTCSVGVNVTLRHGGTRGDYQRINATMPAIWDYARRAGYRTAYIDGQRTGGKLHGMMGPEELRVIDRFVQFDDVPVRDRDIAAADTLAALLRNGTPEFILLNKVGAHFPVHDKYPDAFMRYRPALPRGNYLDISDTGSRAGFGGTPEDWRRYRNAYRNTLLWNVGAFFDRLFSRADLAGATIIYTSDHGQDLHERGNQGLNTHCSSNPVPEEGLVPMVVIEGAGLRTLDWSRTLAANRDKVSHYQIFPTLLALMGYSPEEVRPIYGASLAEPSRDPFTFNTRFNARLGREPAWFRIDLDKVQEPPASDAPSGG